MNYYGAPQANAYQANDYGQYNSAPAPASAPAQQQIQPRESMRVTVKKVTMGNGDTYEGDIVKNRFNGHGTYFYKNGDQYIGDFVDNVQQGKGMTVENNLFKEALI